MHDTGCSGLVHWDDPEGWDGEGDGKGVQDGEHMYTHGRVNPKPVPALFPALFASVTVTRGGS